MEFRRSVLLSDQGKYHIVLRYNLMLTFPAGTLSGTKKRRQRTTK
jgi:hypothetical protein